MSGTDPFAHRGYSSPEAVVAPPRARLAVAVRIEALATRRNAVRALVAAFLLGVSTFLIRPTFPNYDRQKQDHGERSHARLSHKGAVPGDRPIRISGDVLGDRLAAIEHLAYLI